jgi:hypothetical protein
MLRLTAAQRRLETNAGRHLRREERVDARPARGTDVDVHIQPAPRHRALYIFRPPSIDFLPWILQCTGTERADPVREASETGQYRGHNFQDLNFGGRITAKNRFD